MNVEKREDCSSLGCAHFEILLPLLACVSLSGSNFAVVLKTGVENILLGWPFVCSFHNTILFLLKNVPSNRILMS